MTRETQAGLVVASSFLCLLGTVLTLKMSEEPQPGPATIPAPATTKTEPIAPRPTPPMMPTVPQPERPKESSTTVLQTEKPKESTTTITKPEAALSVKSLGDGSRTLTVKPAPSEPAKFTF